MTDQRSDTGDTESKPFKAEYESWLIGLARAMRRFYLTLDSLFYLKSILGANSRCLVHPEAITNGFCFRVEELLVVEHCMGTGRKESGLWMRLIQTTYFA